MTENDPVRLMIVDDEANLLASLKRVFRGEGYIVDTFESPSAAMSALEQDQFDVIVSDMRMPEMSGADFLLHAARVMPDTPRILLTGFSDQESTVRAINDAGIYRYVAKPWDNDELRELVDEAAQVHRTVLQRRTRNQELLKKNLRLKEKNVSLHHDLERNEAELAQAVAFVDLAQDELRHSYETFIKSFANIINLRISNAAQVSLRIQEHCTMVAGVMECQDVEKEAIHNAALLYQLGKIFLPDNLLHKPFCELGDSELKAFQQHPVLAEQALIPINALALAAKIIRHQNECVDGSGFPDGLSGPAIPLGARILKVVIDFNQHLGGLLTGKPETVDSTTRYLKSQADRKYDPAVIKAYLGILSGKNAEVAFENEQFLKTPLLSHGMVVARDLHNHDGILLLSAETKLSGDLIKKLQAYEKRNQIELLVPVKARKGVVETPTTAH
ncbi:MAG: response regulator [Pseudomonadota bacterium]|nr:hypothetical protein [Pseudomonadales bacterium]MDY6920817.1 response regulator [Pseudomonadota bacterium]